MAKYSEKFKLMIVHEYLDGRIGYSELAKNYDLKSKNQIRDWVIAYKKYGVVELFRKKSHEVYSVQFLKRMTATRVIVEFI